ncbi:MAG TPA: cupin domain-containing protein [Dehalococcoidia bacterium]|jgi:mannose-6-phosphate isomerase-like protein (cupin superfamily)|nr:cupin domain-containing protein [Dehalococcoidia bacterium]
MPQQSRAGDNASSTREAVITPPEGVKVVPKPWGEERWLAHTDLYAGKLLILRKGHRLSLQYHERKHETQYVDSGRIKYTLGSTDRPDEYEEFIAEAGTTVMLPPGAIHRMEALEDSRFFEVSTPELTDVVRLDDDYGRTGTSA